MSSTNSVSKTKGLVCPICDKDDGIECRFCKNGYDIYHCGECSGLFVFPQPSEEELTILYDEQYFQRGNKYTSPPTERHIDPNRVNDASKIELLRRYQTSGRLLDVGCAMGGFMEVAREYGYDVTGVEISEYAADYARQQRGLDVKNSDLSSAGFAAQSFDVMTLWDVIEHLREPHRTLVEISRLLRPGGLLLFSTGDASSLWARLTGPYWHLLTPPLHLFFYTPRSLCFLLERHGLYKHDTFYQGKKATLEFIGFKAYGAFGPVVMPLRKIIKVLGLQHYALQVNLHDTLTFIARKSDKTDYIK